MNRRDFIGSCLALVAVPVVPQTHRNIAARLVGSDLLPEGTIFFANRLWMFSGQTVSYSEPIDQQVWS